MITFIAIMYGMGALYSYGLFFGSISATQRIHRFQEREYRIYCATIAAFWPVALPVFIYTTWMNPDGQRIFWDWRL